MDKTSIASKIGKSDIPQACLEYNASVKVKELTRETHKRKKRKRKKSSSPPSDHEHKKHKKKKSKKNKKEKSDKECVDIGPPMPDTTDPTAASTSQEKLVKPMTKDEWEKQQNVVRRVYDPETGRNRLVKGDGEIMEEIVSKNRHKEINKQATQGDGLHYQARMGLH